MFIHVTSETCNLCSKMYEFSQNFHFSLNFTAYFSHTLLKILLRKNNEQLCKMWKDDNINLLILNFERRYENFQQLDFSDLFLTLIVNRGVNISFMETHLKQLTAPETLKLLQYLQYWIHSYCSLRKKDVNRDKNKFRIPILQNIIIWVNMILNSHIIDIITQQDFQVCVRKISSEIQREVKILGELVHLRTQIASFRSFMNEHKVSLVKKINEGEIVQKKLVIEVLMLLLCLQKDVLILKLKFLHF